MDAKPLPPHPNLAHYRKQAKDLLAAAKRGDVAAVERLRVVPRVGRVAGRGGGGPHYVLADAQLSLAREHGFESWPRFAAHIDAVARPGGPAAMFEAAADAIVAGDVAHLASFLEQRPELACERSTRTHHATLLHYVAANGVEDFRQRSPATAAAITRTLLAARADVNATAECYGGHMTTLNLLVSSVHPARAGVQVQVAEALLEFGAPVEGLDDGSPLLTALVFHYPDAADALVRHGARVDTVLAAAGLGEETLVAQFTDSRGRPRSPARLVSSRALRHMPPEPGAQVERALILAAALGHRRVVELLADRGTDLAASDPQGLTALHWAAMRGELEVVDALLARHAPLEVTNIYGGTVLGATIWASHHVDVVFRRGGPVRVDYHPVIERLLAAGARSDGIGAG